MGVALLALFLALDGPATAKRLLDGRTIRKGTISATQVKDRSLGVRELTRGAVRTLERTPRNSVGTVQLRSGAVSASKLGAGSVSPAAIAAGAVAGDKLADGGVGPGKLAENAVGPLQLTAGAVTADKLAAGAVGSGAIADGTLQTVDVGAFTGIVQVDFNAFAPGSCQVAPVTPMPASDGAQPNIADDVIAVSPSTTGWPDPLIVSGSAGAGNRLRLVACYVAAAGEQPVDPGPTNFRYITFDAP